MMRQISKSAMMLVVLCGCLAAANAEAEWEGVATADRFKSTLQRIRRGLTEREFEQNTMNLIKKLTDVSDLSQDDLSERFKDMLANMDKRQLSVAYPPTYPPQFRRRPPPTRFGSENPNDNAPGSQTDGSIHLDLTPLSFEMELAGTEYSTLTDFAIFTRDTQRSLAAGLSKVYVLSTNSVAITKISPGSDSTLVSFMLLLDSSVPQPSQQALAEALTQNAASTLGEAYTNQYNVNSVSVSMVDREVDHQEDGTSEGSSDGVEETPGFIVPPLLKDGSPGSGSIVACCIRSLLMMAAAAIMLSAML